MAISAGQCESITMQFAHQPCRRLIAVCIMMVSTDRMSRSGESAGSLTLLTADGRGARAVAATRRASCRCRPECHVTSLGNIASSVDRHSGAATIGMAHDVVAARYPRHFEPGFLQCPHDLATAYGGNWRHQATSTRSVSSSGTPNSAISPVSASRRSAMAAAGLCPSPLAPTPGRN